MAWAGAFDLNDASWQGCAELLGIARAELGEGRVMVVGVLDWEQIEAEDGILVMHPTKPIDAEEATAFMKAGGRVAIVDDYGKGDRLLQHFKILRRGLPSRPTRFLRNKPALPVAEPVFDTSEGEVLGLHPTVAQVDYVVLNHGTGLNHPDLTPVLEVRAVGDEPVAVAVAGQVGSGRLFAMGDASSFINQMLRYPGNRAFAGGLVRYLANGDVTSERRGRLFVVANEFGERGSFGGVTPLRKSIDRKIEALVEALDELRQDGFPWWMHVATAAFAALLLLWWLTRRMLRLYKTRLPRFARHTPMVAQSGVAGRVAVLASPVSPPALALLELRSALSEAMAHRFGMPPTSSAKDVVDEAMRRGELSAGELGAAAPVLALMQEAESSFVTGRPTRVTRGQVVEAAATVERLLQATGADDLGRRALGKDMSPKKD
jgi:hypothetical protein